MACVSLKALEPGCLNFDLKRGATDSLTLRFFENSVPVDLAAYSSIEMQMRRGGHMMPAVSTRIPGAGLIINGHVLTVVFERDDILFQHQPGAVNYDIAFTKDGITRYLVRGTITINDSITQTWK